MKQGFLDQLWKVKRFCLCQAYARKWWDSGDTRVRMLIKKNIEISKTSLTRA